MDRKLEIRLGMKLPAREDTEDPNGPRAKLDAFVAGQEEGSIVKYSSFENPDDIATPFLLIADLSLIVLARGDAAQIMNAIDSNLDQLPPLIKKIYRYIESGLEE